MPHAAPAPDQLLLMAPSPSGNDPPNPPPLQHSSRILVPPDRYGFPMLFSSLDPISMPTSHSQVDRPQQYHVGKMR